MAKYTQYPTVQDWLDQALDAEEQGYELLKEGFLNAALEQEKLERIKAQEQRFWAQLEIE